MRLGWTTEAATVLHHAAGPIGLIGPVSGMLDDEVLTQPLLDLQQTLRAQPRDRLSLAFALFLELVASLAKPATTALHPSDDHLRVKVNQRRARPDRILGLGPLATRTLRLEGADAERPQRFAAPLHRPQRLGQLITPSLPIAPILITIDPIGLSQDLARELAVIAIGMTRPTPPTGTR